MHLINYLDVLCSLCRLESARIKSIGKLVSVKLADVQKESEDKSEISTPNKDWVNGFKKPANLYDITIGGDAVSSDIQAAQEFPELLKAVLQHRCCPPGLVFNVDESALFFEKKCHHVPSYPARYFEEKNMGP
ncbi:Jerky protein [Trichinella pseudospiralis]